MPVPPHIAIAGQFPPPVTGFAFITQQIAELLADKHPTVIIDLSPHTKRGGISYHLRRLLLTLRGCVMLTLQAVRHRDRRFYTACEGDFGLIYTLMLCIKARALRTPIFIHHHSFGYIDKRVPLMEALIAVAGDKATHIFLCQTMADRFVTRYRSVLTAIISNSAFIAPMPEMSPGSFPARPLTIGLLSNLNDQKGLGRFLDLLRAAKNRDLPLKGVLAGPPDGKAERAAITAAQGELGSMLDYRGPVYGDAKRAFFNAIDIFAFPTAYANEAQPAVIYEALACGIPVLSYDRGCILSQVGSCGAVEQRNADFTVFALEWLKMRLADPGDFTRLRLETLAAFKKDCALSRHKVSTLFDGPPQAPA